MKTTRFLAFAVALAPILAIAQGGSAREAKCNPGWNRSISRDDLRMLDYQRTPSVEALCQQLREKNWCAENCETSPNLRIAFEEVKNERGRLAAQKEDEERKSAEEVDRRRAEIASSGVSEESASEMAGRMYEAYRYGGVGEMLAMENACWHSLAKQKKPTDASAVSCAVSALAGGFVEAAYARQQKRGPAPAYNPSLLRKRLVGNMEKARINEDRAQRILELVTLHQESVLVGLMNAGMR